MTFIEGAMPRYLPGEVVRLYHDTHSFMAQVIDVQEDPLNPGNYEYLCQYLLWRDGNLLSMPHTRMWTPERLILAADHFSGTYHA